MSWTTRFVDALPGDDGPPHRPRQVHAAYSRVRPTPVRAPQLVAHSREVAQLLGFDDDFVHSERFASVFAGNELIDGMSPYASVYGGHQFGHWAGQLGDGRAITLGERVAPDGSVWELQLKGSGPTPFSRSADGRAVLRSSIREFLCSEAMFHLRVPTTRALSLVTTGEPVIRDMFYDGRARPEPGAIVCRVAPSFLRLGSFEIHASRGDTQLLGQLVEHAWAVHFANGHGGPSSVERDGHGGPSSLERDGHPDPASVAVALLTEVCRRTGHLMAEWMRVGFVHGVMNTDNLSLLGLTIDYGPYGWIDDYDPDWTPNTTDLPGRRYAFGRQPMVAGWNLARFAEALYPLVGASEPLEAALKTYGESYNAALREVIAGKLGLGTFDPDRDEALWTELMDLFQLAETDMTVLFRALSRDEPAAIDDIGPAFYDPSALTGDVAARWSTWLDALAARTAGVPDRAATMRLFNPKYVLRNYLAQEAIELAEQGDRHRVAELLEVLRRPYDEQPERERYAAKRPEWARNKPGCSQLSCSS